MINIEWFHLGRRPEQEGTPGADASLWAVLPVRSVQGVSVTGDALCLCCPEEQPLAVCAVEHSKSG